MQQRLSAATRVRDLTPTVWEAFADGVVDWARVRDISATVDTLKREESVARLDARVVAYAADHTAAELRQWLRRFAQRVEADLAVERAEAERADRHVSIRHGDSSMSWLNAYLPSHEAAAIEARLRREARSGQHAGTDDDGDVGDGDDRTVAQREADPLVGWCLDADAAAGVADANIAVVVDADVLAGAATGFAESADGRWAVPAGWMTDVIATGSTFWHRIVAEPITGDVLAHEHLGRYAPDVLDIALQFLHEVCQAPGCMVSARWCDQDHRIPHPTGPTRADNLGPLCRPHRRMKGHGVIHWSTSKNRIV